MSCECNIDYVKKIENENIKIFKLQGICLKCNCTFSSVKKTKKGEGFAKWPLEKFRKASNKNKALSEVESE